MAANDTTVTMVGNLTADPDLRYTASGAALARFTVASTPRLYDRQAEGYRDGDPLFLACTAWRDLAENIAESLTKGARVVVTGRLRLSRWQTPDGQPRSAYGLDVDDLGPSLRFATATVQKMTRTRAGGDGFTPAEVPDDPWASASPTPPTGPAPVQPAA